METLNRSGQSTTGSGSLQRAMRAHPLFFFFLMAYAFSWIISLPYVLSVWGILSGDYTVEFILKPFVGPTLAAIIMLGLLEGKPGLLHLRKRLKRTRAGWQWYLFILAGIPALILLGIVIQPGALTGFQGLTPRILVTYPLYFVVVYFGVALPEEIGWRGFALPRLQSLYGPLRGTLRLGVLWALWHLLYFFTPDHGGGPGTRLTTYAVNFLIFFLMVVALAVIITWVFNHTQGSIFIANLLHAAVDTPQLVWIPLFAGMNETRLNLAALIAFGVPALLIVILTRGRLGYPANQEQPVQVGVPEHDV